MKTRYFQWLEGEQRGKVVTLKNVYKDGTDTYFEFDDGESCIVDFIAPMASTVGEFKSKRKNKDNKIIPAFLIEVSSPTNIWGLERIESHGVDLGTGYSEVAPPIEDIIGVSSDGSVESAEGKFKLVAPPEPVDSVPLPTAEEYEGIITERTKANARAERLQQMEERGEVISEPIVSEQPKQTLKQEKHVSVSTPESDPVSILVNTSKKCEREVNISLSMMLPTKELFDIVRTNFDNGVDKFIDNVIRDLDVTKIVDAIKASLYESYLGSLKSDDKDKLPEPSISSVQQDCLVEFDEDGNVKEQKLI